MRAENWADWLKRDPEGLRAYLSDLVERAKRGETLTDDEVKTLEILANAQSEQK